MRNPIIKKRKKESKQNLSKTTKTSTVFSAWTNSTSSSWYL